MLHRDKESGCGMNSEAEENGTQRQSCEQNPA